MAGDYQRLGMLRCLARLPAVEQVFLMPQPLVLAARDYSGASVNCSPALPVTRLARW